MEAHPARTMAQIRSHLARSRTDRVVAGVAGGLAHHLAIDPVVIRLAFVVMAFAGGAGLVVYLLIWLAVPEKAPPGITEDATAAPAARPRVASPTMQAVSVALVVLGALVILRSAGIWFGDAVVWPVAIAAFGSAVIWTRSDESGRARWVRLASRFPRAAGAVATGAVPRSRIAAGGLLVVAGLVTILATNDALAAVRTVLIAVVATAAGLALILGPWIWQLGHQLTDERRERIRSEERAEFAAHLHDSVLQTLALIQRAGSREEMVTLARGQERELRSWLYRRGARPNGSESLSRAVDELAARVERLHRVPVEAVVVGDSPVDERLRAMIEATGEAAQNAAKHSGALLVSLYVEVGPDAISVYVRDEGRGFDAASLPADRHGIAESIVGRMERHGGTATLATEPAQGTEWHLRMPRRSQ